MLTEVGPVEIDVPRDRDGTFEPQIVKKRQRRLTGVDEMVLSLSAKGLTTGRSPRTWPRSTAPRCRKQTISTITDKVMDGHGRVAEPAAGPVYPVVFIDAINVKIRDGKVANRPIYVALAVTVEGTRDILGLVGRRRRRRAPSTGSRCCTEIKNRGVEDVLMVVCDGLTGLPDAIEHRLAADDRPDLRGSPAAQLVQLRGPPGLGRRSPKRSSRSTPRRPRPRPTERFLRVRRGLGRRSIRRS